MSKQQGVLDRIFHGLRSRHLEQRQRYIGDLARFMDEEGVDVVSGKYLNEKIRDLFASQETKYAGLQCVQCLLGFDYMDANTRFIMFNNHVRSCFPTDIIELALYAADVWGRVIKSTSSTLGVEVVEAELKRALEWLCVDSSTARKHAAVLLIREMATKVPTYFTFNLEMCVEQMWNAVRDTQVYIRETAVSALGALLENVARVQPSSRLTLMIIDKCHRMVHVKATEAGIHGCMLALHRLLLLLQPEHPKTLESFLTPGCPEKIKDVLVNVLNGKVIQNYPSCRLVGYQMLPLLASGTASVFATQYLSETMKNLFAVLKNPSVTNVEKSAVFVCVGGLFKVVRGELMNPYLSEITNYIASNLIPVRRPKKDRCPAAVECLVLLLETAPSTDTILQQFTITQMDALFSVPVTADLAEQLKLVAKYQPSLRGEIQERMLRNLRQTLQTITSEQGDRTLMLQCFDVLCSVDCQGHSLTDLCEKYLEPQFVSPDTEIRTSSLRTCVAILLCGCFGQNIECSVDDTGMILHTGQNHKASISRLVMRLISVAVSDNEPTIRSMLLNALTVKFDQQLSMGQCISQLFIAVEDEVYANREAAMTIIGRLTRRNPACSLPYLRQTLLHVTTDLQFSLSTKKQVLASEMIAHIIGTAPILVKPYVRALLNITIEKLRNPNTYTPVISSLLATLGKLAYDVESRDFPHLMELMPFVLEHIMDKSSSQKRQHALVAFGCIVHATGDVMEPYLRYPNLLSALTTLLHGADKESYLVRKEVLNVIGIVGALDPYEVKRSLILSSTRVQKSMTLLSFQRGAEDIYPKIAIQSILAILSQTTLTDQCYHYAVEALVKIFTTRTMRVSVAVQHLPVVIPAIIKMLSTCERMRDKIFKELFLLVNVMRQHVRVHSQMMLDAVRKYWNPEEPTLLIQILSLVTELRMALNEEFKPELNWLIPQLLNVAAYDNDGKEITLKVLSVIEAFGGLLDTYTHVVVPMLLDCVSGTDFSMEIRSRALGTLTALIQTLPLVQYSSRIVHILLKLVSEESNTTERSVMVSLPTVASLEGWSEALQSAAMRPAQATGGTLTAFNTDALYALCALVCNLGQYYKNFIPMVSHELNAKLAPTHPLLVYYHNLVRSAVTQNAMAKIHTAGVTRSNAPPPTDATSPSVAVVRTSDQMMTMLRLLQTANRNTADHWPYWLTQVSMELIKESPSPAFRACVALAQVHPPLAQELFNASFTACFHLQMDNTTRENVLGYLKEALCSPTIPVEVLQVLLNLSEYMSHYDQHLPSTFDPRMLSSLAEQCQLYAKALRYTETTFTQIVSNYETAKDRGEIKRMSTSEWQDFIGCCEKMISLATKLGLPESAQGVLAYVQKNFASMTGQADWGGEFAFTDAEMCEKLQWWTEAWKAYEVRYRRGGDMKAAVGVLRAMEAMGEWAKLLAFWKELVPKSSVAFKEEMAPMASHAAWLLTKWSDMETATKMMRPEGYTGATLQFYRAVLSVNAGNIESAEVHIAECRKTLDGVLTALIGESYSRAYDKLVGLQQMSELEEIVHCLRKGNKEEDRKVISQMWSQRLTRMQPEMEIWQGTITNHTLLLPPDQDVQAWLQFVKICSVSEKHKIARRALMRLLGQSTECETNSLGFLTSGGKKVHNDVVIAYLDHIWTVGQKLEAMQLLSEFREFLKTDESATNRNKAACHLRFGTWKNDLGANFDFQQILGALSDATQLDPDSYDVWHTYATFNTEAMKSNTGRESTLALELNPESEVYVLNAFKAYVQAVRCDSTENSLQDVLRLLSMWFTYGTNPKLYVLIKDSIDRIPLTTWLRVVPQIIARVHLRQPEIHETIFLLLSRIGAQHPHAILFPLQVFINGDLHPSSSAKGAAVAEVQTRRKAAQELITLISGANEASGRILSQVHEVSRSLIRIASLWSEMLFDAIEEVHRVGFPEKTKNATIDPLAFELIEPFLAFFSNAETPAEQQFLQIYGEELKEIQEAINNGEHRQAWDLLLQVYRKIQKQRPYLTSLDLQFACPKLLEPRQHSHLVMPGQYNWAKADNVGIQSFDPILKVITSKQRPRKLIVRGTNGVEYKYLLKGHEDLRLDERVMQLFGLVNVALSKDILTAKRDLFIEQYPVIPLSDNAGLIGWVDNAETLHVLIRDYRKQNGIDMGIEHTYMTNTMTSEYDKLSLIQKVEVFEMALEKTDGNDLKRIMWQTSQNSEVWLDRRTMYIRSLATMSMVGYILGLGDRHPSNVMLDSASGKIVHIDFGDCFEVAMSRDVFPEKIPFRLTRMLVNAMEVCGLDGLFRHTCDLVMTLLRRERESVKALLEAFAHDPLVNWRLVEVNKGDERKMKRIAAVDAFNSVEMESSKYSRSCFEKSVKGGTYMGGNEPSARNDSSQKKAQEVIARISAKLEGKEFMMSEKGMTSPTTPTVVLQNVRETSVEVIMRQRSRNDSFIDTQNKILQQLKSSGIRGSLQTLINVDKSRSLTVPEQVDMLVREATSPENLCQCYLGWCPFW